MPSPKKKSAVNSQMTYVDTKRKSRPKSEMTSVKIVITFTSKRKRLIDSQMSLQIKRLKLTKRLMPRLSNKIKMLARLPVTRNVDRRTKGESEERRLSSKLRR